MVFSPFQWLNINYLSNLPWLRFWMYINTVFAISVFIKSHDEMCYTLNTCFRHFERWYERSPKAERSKPWIRFFYFFIAIGVCRMDLVWSSFRTNFVRGYFFSCYSIYSTGNFTPFKLRLDMVWVKNWSNYKWTRSGYFLLWRCVSYRVGNENIACRSHATEAPRKNGFLLDRGRS